MGFKTCSVILQIALPVGAFCFFWGRDLLGWGCFPGRFGCTWSAWPGFRGSSRHALVLGVLRQAGHITRGAVPRVLVSKPDSEIMSVAGNLAHDFRSRAEDEVLAHFPTCTCRCWLASLCDILY